MKQQDLLIIKWTKLCLILLKSFKKKEAPVRNFLKDKEKLLEQSMQILMQPNSMGEN